MKQFFTTLSLFLALAAQLSAQTIYVRAGAAGANNGTSWADAFTSLDAALDVAQPGQDIWVAAGTYKPSGGTPASTFIVEAGINIYGGFAGTETSLSQRNLAANVTRLSGDFNNDDVAGEFSAFRADNAQHVLYVLNGNPQNRTILDGLTIAHGNTSNNANDPELTRHGGGVLVQAKATIRHCRFEQNFGRAGGSIAALDAAANGLLVDNCTFSNNFSTSQSAGVYVRSSTAAEVNKCTFNNNKTNRGCVYPNLCKNFVVDSCTFENNSTDPNQFGASMFTWQSSFKVSNCIFRNNSAHNSAGIYNDGREGGNSFIIENCLFENNTTTGTSGAGINNFTANFEIRDCIFRNNTALTTAAGIISQACKGTIKRCTFENGQANFGGAMAVYSKGSEMTVDSCTFTGNTANTSGGGIINGFIANLTVKNSTFNDNTARWGGGIFNQNDSTVLNIQNTAFTGNTVENLGGGIYGSGGINITIHDSEFSGNTANLGGAVAINEDSLELAVLTVSNTIMRENTTLSQGGAIYAADADVTLTNCLLASNINVGDNPGGAISNNATGIKTARVVLINSTLAENLSGFGGGVAQWEANDTSSAELTLLNSIIANPLENHFVEQGTPVVISLGGNLSSDNTMNDFLTNTKDINEVDPQFVDFAAGDFHLAAGSPCIDGGVAAAGVPTTDIDGNPRIGSPDKGSYEFPTSSTHENLQLLALQLTPNPAVDYVQTTIANEWNGPVQVQLTTGKGQLVRTLNSEKAGNTWTFRTEVADLPAGLYFVQARMGNALYVGTFVK